MSNNQLTTSISCSQFGLFPHPGLSSKVTAPAFHRFFTPCWCRGKEKKTNAWKPENYIHVYLRLHAMQHLNRVIRLYPSFICTFHVVRSDNQTNSTAALSALLLLWNYLPLQSRRLWSSIKTSILTMMCLRLGRGIIPNGCLLWAGIKRVKCGDSWDIMSSEPAV